MKLQFNKNAEDAVETHRVVITMGETEYRITENVDGGIRVNKVNFSNFDSLISVQPSSSNEIVIK